MMDFFLNNIDYSIMKGKIQTGHIKLKLDL
jgi:hypothetical protein